MTLCAPSNSIKLVNLCNAQNVASVEVEANIMDQHGAIFHSDFYDMFVLSAEAAATAADAAPSAASAASAAPSLRSTASAPLGALNFRDTVVAHPTVLPVVLKNRTEYATTAIVMPRFELRILFLLSHLEYARLCFPESSLAGNRSCSS